MRVSESRFIKGSLTPSDSVTVAVTLTGGIFWMGTVMVRMDCIPIYLAHHYGHGDGIVWCEQ